MPVTGLGQVIGQFWPMTVRKCQGCLGTFLTNRSSQVRKHLSRTLDVRSEDLKLRTTGDVSHLCRKVKRVAKKQNQSWGITEAELINLGTF